MGKFNEKKEKWTNKGTDKQYVADFLIHITNCHTRCLYKFLKSQYCQVSSS